MVIPARMKYSFMTFSTPELTLDETLTVAVRYGYDGVEVRIDADHVHGIETTSSVPQRRSIEAAFASAGVSLCCIATSVSLANPETLGAMIEKAHSAIDLAADLGVPVIRVFGGDIPSGCSREQAISSVAESLSGLAERASECGVTICLETHDSWTDPAHVAGVMRMTANTAIAVNWDVMHPVRTNKATIEDAFELLKPYIRHVHVHDNVGTGVMMVPLGTGEINHRTVVRLLVASGYRGYISGEWIGMEHYEVHLPRELAKLKEYELTYS